MIMIDEHTGFLVQENFIFIMLFSTLCPINLTLLLRYVPTSGVFGRCTITFMLYREVDELSYWSHGWFVLSAFIL
jgi:hypothetical protein